MINFKKYPVLLQKSLLDSISKFESENPETLWSNVAFEVLPYYGTMFISFDTPEHSKKRVAKYPDWCGEDELGKFNNNPADFAFPFFFDLEFSEWEVEYFNEEKYQAETLTGERIDIKKETSEKDIETTHNFLVLELFKHVIENTLHEIERVSINHLPKARVGVHSGECNFEFFAKLPR